MKIMVRISQIVEARTIIVFSSQVQVKESPIVAHVIRGLRIHQKEYPIERRVVDPRRYLLEPTGEFTSIQGIGFKRLDASLYEDAARRRGIINAEDPVERYTVPAFFELDESPEGEIFAGDIHWGFTTGISELFRADVQTVTIEHDQIIGGIEDPESFHLKPMIGRLDVEAGFIDTLPDHVGIIRQLEISQRAALAQR